MAETVRRRFDLVLEAAPPDDNTKAVRRARMKRNQEIFYRCYRSVEKSSDLPQTFNAQYGLFRGLLTTFVLLVLISAAFGAYQSSVARTPFLPHLFFGGVYVDMVAVGQGDAFMLTLGTPQRDAFFLIDGGPPDAGDTGADFVVQHAGGKLDVVIGTHLDLDHIGGLTKVVERCSVGKFYLNLPKDVRTRCWRSSSNE